MTKTTGISDSEGTVTISEKAHQATSYCNKDFTCLCPDRRDVCPVEKRISREFCFVTCNSKGQKCNYCLRFGYGHICACPVRQELFNDHRI